MFFCHTELRFERIMVWTKIWCAITLCSKWNACAARGTKRPRPAFVYVSRTILLPRWKKSNSARSSQGKLRASSFDHVLPTFLRMSWIKEKFFISCCKGKKLLDFCRHRLIWFDQIYYKLLRVFYRFNSKLCQNAWMKSQYIFKKKKVRNLNV